jgi:uncharacterized membrane protein YoaK (UPF0700 family)
MLLMLTVVTGLVDAVSYLALGHVFVANMTGNVVFLGFAVGGARDFSIAAMLLALTGFLLGAVAGGRLALNVGAHRGRHLAFALWAKVVLVAAALAVALAAPDVDVAAVRWALIVLLAIGMGLQNATARHLAVPDLTTTVLTLTLTGMAADSALAGSGSPHTGRRLLAAIAMFSGAAIGALLLYHAGISAVLALVFAVLLGGALASCRWVSSSEPWTVR